MGGSIRVVHKLNGVITKQTRWTNSLDDYVQNSQFIKSDPEHIQEYLNRPTDYGEPPEHFAPNGYGLDFFDFDKKEIHTWQGYTSYQDIEYIALFLWLLGHVSTINGVVDGKVYLTRSTDQDEYFFPHEVRKMWNENMLSGITYTGSYEDHWMQENIKILSKEEMGNPTFEECLSMLENTHEPIGGKKRLMYAEHYKEGFPKITGFQINWSNLGWTLHEYPETLQGLKDMKAAIEIDNPFTPEDEKVWEEFMEDRYGEENED